TSSGVGENLRAKVRRQSEDRHRRLLPHRRTLQPHLVCSHLPAGTRQRSELRWFLDRVGQSRGGAHREGCVVVAAVAGRGMSSSSAEPRPATTATGALPLQSADNGKSCRCRRCYRVPSAASVHMNQWLAPSGCSYLPTAFATRIPKASTHF